MKTFPLSVFAINQEIFIGRAKSITATGVSGRLQILPAHAPLITPLVAGDIIIEKTEEQEVLPIVSGILEVNNKEVVILVNF